MDLEFVKALTEAVMMTIVILLGITAVTIFVLIKYSQWLNKK